MSIIDSYKKILPSNLNLSTDINTYVPVPTDDDYNIGYIRRYFAQRSNDTAAPIYEISSSEYSRIRTTPYFKVVQIRWRISGPLNEVINDMGKVIDKGVRQSNLISISLVRDEMPNLKLYLNNLLQFYK